MMLSYIIGIAFISNIILPFNTNNFGVVNGYILPIRSSLRKTQHTSCARHCNNSSGRPSLLQLRSVIRSWQSKTTIRSSSGNLLVLSGSFYDDGDEFSDFSDFSDFGDLSGGDKSSNNDGKDNKDDSKKPESSNRNSSSSEISGGVGAGLQGDDALMGELRKRMNDLSKQRENDDIYEEDDDEDDEEEMDDDDDTEESGSALPNLEGNTLSNIDDLIGFAQQKAARKKSAERDQSVDDELASLISGNTWEDENWARPIPLTDEDTGDEFNIDDLLEGGIILIANPAKFCSDLATDKNGDDTKSKEKDNNSFLGGLFDDPFPSASSQSNNISPALLAKFGITLPPSPDLGPDRRADLLPVVMFIGTDTVRGSQAVLMNRRTGNLIGDLPTNAFEDDVVKDEDDPFASHPLGAFMIQPLWWAGSSPGGNADDENPSNRGGINAIDMIHACPYVDGSVVLPKSDGLYWGGSPIQAQKAMKDERLEKPLSGFDFKFYIQTTRWLPSQVCHFVSLFDFV